MFLLHKSIEFDIITIPIRTVIHLQNIRICDGDKFIILINVYTPPTRARVTMSNESSAILKYLRLEYSNDKTEIIGDLDMSNAKWDFSNDTKRLQISNIDQFSKAKKKFFATINTYGFEETNRFANSRESSLDLVFSTDPTIVSIKLALECELIDANSYYHNALSIDLLIQNMYKVVSTTNKKMNYAATKTFQLRMNEILMTTKFQSLATEDINNFFTGDRTSFLRKTDLIHGTIKMYTLFCFENK